MIDANSGPLGPVYHADRASVAVAAAREHDFSQEMRRRRVNHQEIDSGALRVVALTPAKVADRRIPCERASSSIL